MAVDPSVVVDPLFFCFKIDHFPFHENTNSVSNVFVFLFQEKKFVEKLLIHFFNGKHHSKRKKKVYKQYSFLSYIGLFFLTLSMP